MAFDYFIHVMVSALFRILHKLLCFNPLNELVDRKKAVLVSVLVLTQRGENKELGKGRKGAYKELTMVSAISNASSREIFRFNTC